ncbi:hypothetical protein LD110_05560 [Arthrobacter sp. M4]|nr:hypothetical protein [Arthrobacter sp. M4]
MDATAAGNTLEGKTSKHRGSYPRTWQRWIDGVQGAAEDLLSLVSPVECVCCEALDTQLCASCARRIRRQCRTPFRAELQAPALIDADGTATLAVVAAGVYRDELAQALLAFKRHGQWRVADVLAPMLAHALDAAVGGRGGFVLVPVPSSGAAFRRRGFSPVDLLLWRLRCRGLLLRDQTVRALRRRVRAPTLNELLQSITSGGAMGQKGLGRGARARRVRGSMSVSRWPYLRELRGQRCVIVDDVLTTGATLAEAARAIRKGGGEVCGAVVLAATRPPTATMDAKDR